VLSSMIRELSSNVSTYNRAGFKLGDFRQPPAMSVFTAEPGAKKVRCAIPGNGDSHRSAAKAEHIQVAD
jgi:hypothetical protein